MKLADLSIKRPIMMTMILLVFVLFGGIAYFSMNLEFTPEMTLPIVTIQTTYPGAGPQEIETQVTKRLEDAVSPVSGIDNIQSYTMENASFIIVSFDIGKDINIALQEIKDKIGGVTNDLPDDADLPVAQTFNLSSVPVVEIVLSGNIDPTELYDIADKELSNKLSQIKGVATVDITGGAEREIRIEVDNQMAMQYGISLTTLSGILSAQNIDMPGGNIQRSSQEFSVRLNGQFGTAEQIRDLQVPTSTGMMRLGDIATVSDIGEEQRQTTTYRNYKTGKGDNDVVLLSVQKASGGNAVEIYDQIVESLPEFQETLPKGCTINVVNENASFTRSSVFDTFQNIILGIILTSLILLFFLHDYKSTIIIALSMPMSIISTFMFMQWAGYTFNIMSLMGLSTSVGILVTNSIVVLENIFRHKELGHNRRDSASKGTGEIAIAVIASTMTNLVVFLPLATMSSIVGQLFEQFSMTVVFATIFSLIMSFTLTPMLASIILPDHDKKKHPLGAKLEKMFHSWEQWYKRMLSSVLRSKKRGLAVVGSAIALFVVTILFAGNLGFEFMPNIDEGIIGVRVELPVGTDMQTTAYTMNDIEDRLTKYPEIQHTWTTIGTQGSFDVGVHLAYLKIKLSEKDQRERSTQDVISAMMQDMATIPDAKIRISSITSNDMGGDGDIQFDLTGNDLDELEKIKNKLVPQLENIDGLLNLNNSSRAGKPEIVLTPRRELIAASGLTLSDIALIVRSSIDGLTTTTLKDKGEEYDIRVTATDESVDTPEEIGQIPVVGPHGTYTLEQLTDIEYTEGYSKILRLDRAREIKFTGDIAPGFAMGDIMNEIEKVIASDDLPAGYGIQWGAQAKEMTNTTNDIGFAFIIAIVLTYMLLAAILESFSQPLLILGTIPFALVGVVFAMLGTGLEMNIISMLSVVMLIGIVVNNAILLLDYTNQLVREKGYSAHDALVEACPTKLKPIIMSTLAIILGMLPMAIGIGSSGAEMRQPMGVVSIGGLLVSTILSLVMIPVLYNVVSRKKQLSNTAKQEA